MNVKNSRSPWYREPWPWLLMIGPAAAIIGGIVTAWLAFATSDGLVEDDYYKQGLAVNQRIQRDAAAAAGSLNADLMLGADRRSVRVLFRAAGNVVPPARLGLSFAHPTRSGLDQKIELERHGDEFYSGRLVAPLSGRWHASLYDTAGNWRLLADWDVDHNSALKMTPLAGAGSARK
jgi:uncharacterized protein